MTASILRLAGAWFAFLILCGSLFLASLLPPTPAPSFFIPVIPACAETGGEEPFIAPLAAAPRRIDYIVLHHWGAPPPASVEVARRSFVSRGYLDIAYNALITEKGALWTGRSEATTSAATRGLNTRSVAVCLLADLSKRPVSDAALETAGRWLVGALRRYPGAKLIQHRDAARITKTPAFSTSCPGEGAVAAKTARTIFLLASGFKLPEAKRRALAGH